MVADFFCLIIAHPRSRRDPLHPRSDLNGTQIVADCFWQDADSRGFFLSYPCSSAFPEGSVASAFKSGWNADRCEFLLRFVNLFQDGPRPLNNLLICPFRAHVWVGAFTNPRRCHWVRLGCPFRANVLNFSGRMFGFFATPARCLFG